MHRPQMTFELWISGSGEAPVPVFGSTFGGNSGVLCQTSASHQKLNLRRLNAELYPSPRVKAAGTYEPRIKCQRLLERRVLWLRPPGRVVSRWLRVGLWIAGPCLLDDE